MPRAIHLDQTEVLQPQDVSVEGVNEFQVRAVVPGTEARAATQAEITQSEAALVGAQFTEDLLLGFEAVVATFGTEGANLGAALDRPVTTDEGVHVEVLDTLDGLEILVDPQIRRAQFHAAIEAAEFFAVNGVARIHSSMLAIQHGEVSMRMTGHVEQFHFPIAAQTNLFSAHPAQVHRLGMFAALLEDPLFHVTRIADAVLFVVAIVTERIQFQRRYAHFFVEFAATEQSLRGGLFHASVAAGVIEVAVGVDDPGQVAGIQSDLLEEGQDDFLRIGRATGVHQQRLVTDEQHQLQRASTDLPLDHVNAVEDFHRFTPCLLSGDEKDATQVPDQNFAYLACIQHRLTGRQLLLLHLDAAEDLVRKLPHQRQRSIFAPCGVDDADYEENHDRDFSDNDDNPPKYWDAYKCKQNNPRDHQCQGLFGVKQRERIVLLREADDRYDQPDRGNRDVTQDSHDLSAFDVG